MHFDTPFQRIGTVGFWLGSDDLGRDTMSRVFYGTRASLEVGLLSVALAVVVGVPLGLVSGWWRTLDAFVARLTDLLLAFPFLILAVGLAAIRGASLTNAALALGIAQVPTMIRVVRAETLRWRGRRLRRRRPGRWTRAARWILFRHILPNAASAVIVQATVIMPVAIIGEATLSFLGLGIRPPAPSLGIMLSDAQQYIFRAPSAAVIPGVDDRRDLPRLQLLRGRPARRPRPDHLEPLMPTTSGAFAFSSAPPAPLTRPDLRGTFGMVATTHWVASATGQAVLERGGNAFDAAVAAAFVLHLVEPHLNGPGGDLSALVSVAGDAGAAGPRRPGPGAGRGDASSTTAPRASTWCPARGASRPPCPARSTPGCCCCATTGRSSWPTSGRTSWATPSTATPSSSGSRRPSRRCASCSSGTGRPRRTSGSSTARRGRRAR